ncbi:polymer-forming cytoskeletal protein [Vicingus serpentipes]|uniref:Polymer-forming cytoskeletal protein n=1 Tax=Vicingus serpentipes TaxID=1926625 RepID=A0A5C6RRQ3_9FLAO|nr:polymer-forming cytoskeletal protein [Vicingus serpentipes]TXB64330.1 polymer-forming cytoskeletal protein [Vicingus serpentipes]
MAKTNDTDASAINIIRKGTVIKGDISCQGDIRIDGELKGKLISEGKVVVGATGIIDGEVTCKNADISGTLNAVLKVKELLLLKSTANIIGDIKTTKLSIEPGANFTGSCNMGGVVKGMKNDEKQPAFEEAQTA